MNENLDKEIAEISNSDFPVMLNTKPSFTQIHPAIDFTEEHAYIGQIRHIRCGKVPYIIMDNRTAIKCEGHYLSQHEITLTHSDFTFDQRWSSTSIEQFTNNTAKAPEKINLFTEIKKQYETYLDFDDKRLYDLLAIWSIGTYYFPLFNSYPYIYVGGIMNSGKSKVLELSSCICFNSVLAQNMSTAAIYRLIQNSRCSLFWDETKELSFQNMAEDSRNILLGGYKNGAKVYRNRKTSDGNFSPESFEIYGPKMLANIEGIEEVLGSRCIQITMRRSNNKQITERYVDLKDTTHQRIRNDLYVFLMQSWKTVKKEYTELRNDTDLACRNWELWKPILALARFFDEDTLFNEMKTLATEKNKASSIDDEETDEYRLVETLVSMVTEDSFYDLKSIKEQLTYNGCRWLTEQSIARLLKRLAFSRRRRVGSGVQFFITVSEVAKIAEMFGIKKTSEDSEPSEPTGEQGKKDSEGQPTSKNPSG